MYIFIHESSNVWDVYHASHAFHALHACLVPSHASYAWGHLFIEEKGKE